jgi:hypothetical protein
MVYNSCPVELAADQMESRFRPARCSISRGST